MQGGLCVLLSCLSRLHLPRLQIVTDTNVQVAPSLQVLRALLFPKKDILCSDSYSIIVNILSLLLQLRMYAFTSDSLRLWAHSSSLTKLFFRCFKLSVQDVRKSLYSRYYFQKFALSPSPTNDYQSEHLEGWHLMVLERRLYCNFYFFLRNIYTYIYIYIY